MGTTQPRLKTLGCLAVGLAVGVLVVDPLAGADKGGLSERYCDSGSFQENAKQPTFEELEVVEAVFLDLVRRYGEEGSFWAGPTFFLRIGEAGDPPSGVLSAVRAVWPDTRPVSESAPIGPGVPSVQSQEGDPGVILWISKFSLLGPGRALACGGVYKDGLAARGEQIELERSEGGGWSVTSVTLEWLS